MSITKIDKRLLQIFLQLVRIESLSQDERDAADFIKNFLKQLNYEPFEDDSAPKTDSNSGNIICSVGNGGDRLLVSHMDTARSTKSVEPELKEDRVTSNGKSVLGVDNRAGIAVILYLLEKISTENIPVENFTAAFTTCEETSLDGSKFLEIDENIRKAFVFDSYLRPGHFITKSFGAASFKIKIIGKASHAGIAPEEGINALSIFIDAVKNIKIGNVDEDTTLNIGLIRGGNATNVVPDFVDLQGEIRTSSISKGHELLKTVREVFSSHAEIAGGTIEFAFNWDFEPYAIDIDSEVYQNVFEALEKLDLDPKPSVSKGGSDANSFNSRGISAVNIGIGAQKPHSNDEFILFEDLQNAYKIAMEIVKND